MILSCLAAIALCGFVGAFSSSMITRFDVPPFIVTLAIMLALGAAASRNGEELEGDDA